jgi:hypothetical protein
MSRLRTVLEGPNVASGRPVLAEDTEFSDHLPTEKVCRHFAI